MLLLTIMVCLEVEGVAFFLLYNFGIQLSVLQYEASNLLLKSSN